jgi:hypothetical protein
MTLMDFLDLLDVVEKIIFRVGFILLFVKELVKYLLKSDGPRRRY